MTKGRRPRPGEHQPWSPWRDRLRPAGGRGMSGKGLGDSADFQLCRVTQKQRTRDQRKHEGRLQMPCFRGMSEKKRDGETDQKGRTGPGLPMVVFGFVQSRTFSGEMLSWCRNPFS